MSSLADSLGDMFAEQLSGMDEDNDQFAQTMHKQRDAVDEALQRAMQKFGNKKGGGPSYSEEVVQIANMLTAFPKLVPVVQHVIANVTSEIDRRFDEVAAKYTQGDHGGNPGAGP